jgi:hypothetical protein
VALVPELITSLRLHRSEHSTNMNIHDYAQRVAALVKAKQLHRAARDGTLSPIIEALRAGLSSVSVNERALSVATLGKIGMVIRGEAKRISEALQSLDPNFPVDLLALDSADDRYYAAAHWRFAKFAWSPEVLARSAIVEDTGETFRRECLDGLMQLSMTVAAALEQLIPHVKSLSFSTEFPAESKSKRLRRVLAALRNAVKECQTEPGEDVGSRLRDVLGAGFRGNEVPGTSKQDLGEECLGFIHDVIRLDFALATSPSTYMALRTIRHWHQQSEWERYLEISSSARAVAKDVERALELLARAGVPDKTLFEYLSILLGDERHARSRAENIAQRNPALEQEVADWLCGRVLRRRSSELATGSQYQQADELIADLLIQQNVLGTLEDQIHNDVLPRLRVLEQQSAAILETWVTKVRAFSNASQAIADMRGLSLVGTVGDVVDFSPIEHQLTNRNAFGSRRVLIIRPMVVAEAGGERRRVVRKALVDPCD